MSPPDAPPAPHDAPPVAIGIDAGGSHTRGVAVDAGGAVRARAARPGANPRTVGDAYGRAQIRHVVADLRAAAPGPVAHLVLGLAGLLDPADASENTSWARELGLPAVTVDSDVRIAHAAAFGAGAGVMVVAGTGSQCLAVGAAGERVRVGGWGPAFGDEGSAYWIAASAIRAALHALDAGRPDPLVEAVFEFADIDPDVPHLRRNARLLDVLYDPSAGAASHARFAPAVTALAERGDPEAAALLDRAGVLLADMAILATRRTGERKVACAGSVLDGSRAVRAAFEAAVRRAGLEVVPRRWEPVLGAAFLAMAAAGWDAEAAGARWGRAASDFATD